MEPLSLIRDIIITMNGIVYQWNKEPNKEILIQNTPIQHFNQLNLTRKLLILYTVTSLTNTIVNTECQEQSVTIFAPAITPNGHYGEEITSSSFIILSWTMVASCWSFFLSCTPCNTTIPTSDEDKSKLEPLLHNTTLHYSL